MVNNVQLIPFSSRSVSIKNYKPTDLYIGCINGLYNNINYMDTILFNSLQFISQYSNNNISSYVENKVQLYHQGKDDLSDIRELYYNLVVFNQILGSIKLKYSGLWTVYNFGSLLIDLNSLKVPFNAKRALNNAGVLCSAFTNKFNNDYESFRKQTVLFLIQYLESVEMKSDIKFFTEDKKAALNKVIEIKQELYNNLKVNLGNLADIPLSSYSKLQFLF